MKLCECGCGLPAPIAKRTNKKLGHVKGQPVRFIVGHHNKVREIVPKENRFWEKVDKRSPEECWDWRGADDQHGYGQIRIAGRLVKAHRFSYEIHFGPIPPGKQVLHRCDRPPCCNPAHLFLGTAKENIADMWVKGRGSLPPRNDVRGERNGHAQFTNEQVRRLRREFVRTGISVSAFAKLHNVPLATMWRIVHFKSYQNA